MKKLLLWGILFGLSGWVPTQAQKGATYWGGTVSFSGKQEKNRLIFHQLQHEGQHILSPEIQWGKFVNSSTIIGLGLVYNFSWLKNTREPTGSLTKYQNRSIHQSLELLPFVRKYKFLNERWAVFLHGEVGPTYGWNNVKSVTDQEFLSKGNYWIYSLSIKPGLVYSFPGKRISIEGYANILSLQASYSSLQVEANQSRQFNFSTFLSTGFPNAFELRLAKNINPSAPKL